MIRFQLTILCAAALTACGDTSLPEVAVDNPICTLFKADELSGYVGNSLLDGKNASTGLGCQWLTKDNKGDVMIVVVPRTLHEAPTQVDGYAVLPDVGLQGFTAPFVDGWSAAAIVGEESVRVAVAGEVANAEAAARLLKETILRRGNPAP